MSMRLLQRCFNTAYLALRITLNRTFRETRSRLTGPFIIFRERELLSTLSFDEKRFPLRISWDSGTVGSTMQPKLVRKLDLPSFLLQIPVFPWSPKEICEREYCDDETRLFFFLNFVYWVIFAINLLFDS